MTANSATGQTLENIDQLLSELDDGPDTVIGGAESRESRSRKMIRALALALKIADNLADAAERMVRSYKDHLDRCRPCTINWQRLRDAAATYRAALAAPGEPRDEDNVNPPHSGSIERKE